MKNRKLLLIVSVVLAMTMSLGGTLAYLTDSDGDVNVMTVGRVEIKQNEQKRDGSAFEGQMLLPLVGSTTAKDANGYRTAANYIDKLVTVTNTGNTNAWVRTLIAFPELTHPEYDFAKSSTEVIHWNGGSYTDLATTNPAAVRLPGSGEPVRNNWWWGTETTSDWPGNSNEWNVVKGVMIEGLPYTVHIVTNVAEVTPKETTAPNLFGIYLDSRVDYDYDEKCYTWNKKNITFNDAAKTKLNAENVKIYVLSQAVQASGFENAWDAFEEAFKLGENPATTIAGWFSTVDKDTEGEDNVPPEFPPEADVWVSSDADLAEAVEAGNTTIGLKAGTFHMPAAAKGKTLTLIGESTAAVIEVVPAGQGEANGQLDYNLDGSTVTFNNLTIKTNSQTYAGFARLSGTYNNCVIQNTYNLGTGNSVFNDCTFNITNEYLRVGGAYSAEFNGCTFNTEGRAILVFQDGTSVDQTVTVKDCTFNATAAANTWNGIHVAAVSADGSQGGTYVVNFEGNNVVDSDFNGLWQIKAGEHNITVNGLN